MKEGFKRAYYRRIPAYFNESTSEIEGRNWFYTCCILVNVWFDFQVLRLSELPILVEKDEE